MLTTFRRGLARALGPLAVRCVGRAAVENAEFLAARPRGLLERLAHAEIVRRYYRAGEDEIRRLNRERFWGADAGRQWHRAKRAHRETDAGRAEEARWRAPILRQLEDLLSSNRSMCRLVEIGTGTGEFLTDVAARVPRLADVVGLDLNAAQVEENRATCAGARVRFEHAEASAWLRAYRHPGVVVLAYGTFEYFTPQELDEVLRLVAALPRPAAVAIADTVAMDLRTDLESRPRGELAYSHHYPYRLRQAGFAIVSETLTPVDPARPEYAQVAVIGVVA
jgi:SAM-dependent methyltransferase